MGIVANFISHPAVDITRKANDGYFDRYGKWQKATDSVFQLNLCIQPVNQKDRLLLPEGVRQDEVLKIYSEDIELIITDEKNKVKGDRFDYNNRTYEFFSRGDWQTGIYDMNYYKTFAKLVDYKEEDRSVS